MSDHTNSIPNEDWAETGFDCPWCGKKIDSREDIIFQCGGVSIYITCFCGWSGCAFFRLDSGRMSGSYDSTRDNRK